MAGIPPQDSNLIKPTINAVLGLEARSRTDYRVTSDDESQAEIAEGLSARIKEVETESQGRPSHVRRLFQHDSRGVSGGSISRANLIRSNIRIGCGRCIATKSTGTGRQGSRICPMHDICGGINGWTGFRPHKCSQTSPNSWQIAGSGWSTLDVYEGSEHGMARAYEVEQAWGHNQEDYLNRNSGMVRFSELWYRHYEDAHVLALPDGRRSNISEDNPSSLGGGCTRSRAGQKSVLTRMRVSIWLGPQN